MKAPVVVAALLIASLHLGCNGAQPKPLPGGLPPEYEPPRPFPSAMPGPAPSAAPSAAPAGGAPHALIGAGVPVAGSSR